MIILTCVNYNHDLPGVVLPRHEITRNQSSALKLSSYTALRYGVVLSNYLSLAPTAHYLAKTS